MTTEPRPDAGDQIQPRRFLAPRPTPPAALEPSTYPPEGYDLVPGKCPALGSGTGPAACNCTGACQSRLVKLPEPSSVLPAVQPRERAGEAQDGLSAFADAVARVTPCSCSAQRERAEAAEAEIERLGSVVRDYGQQAITKANEHAAVAGERDALAVKLARVEAALVEVQAVADRRDPTSAPHETDVATARAMGRVNGIDWAVSRVRAALADAASPSGLDDDAPTEADAYVRSTVDLLAALQASADKAREARREAGR